MAETTPEESEALIDAIARGEVPAGDDGFAAAMTAAHIRPADPRHAAPVLAGYGGMGAAGYMRRTAVGATVGLLALVGVAAAGTAGVALLSSGGGGAEIVEGDDLPPETTLPPTTTAGPEPAAAEAEGDEGDAGDESDRERGDEIEGVDASDGLDDDELELICEAAVNHGEYVSAVARDRQGGEDGENRGSRVSEAAQSDCGKKDADTDDGDADADADADDDAADDSDEDGEDGGKPDHSDGPGNGNGNAKGHDKNGKNDRQGDETIEP